MKHFDVTAAIIINNNEILCMHRDKGKFDYEIATIGEQRQIAIKE